MRWTFNCSFPLILVATSVVVYEVLCYLGCIENPFEIRIISKGPLDARYGGGDISSGDRKNFDSHVERMSSIIIIA